MQELSGRVAVITGGASGIGWAMAQRFAGAGMKLVLADVEEAALADAVAALVADGTDAIAVTCDVSDLTQIEALAERSFDYFGGVHVLCNNAGVVSRGSAWETSKEDWDWVLGVDLWGVIHGVRSFLPRMIAAGEPGHVVNTASTAGLMAFPGIAPYNVAKAGVVALSETMAHELPADIGVSVLCPGLVKTRIFVSERNHPTQAAPVDYDPETGLEGQSEALSPEVVAEQVHDAVVSNRFWILPHAHYGDQARTRAAGIGTDARPHQPLIDR